VRFIQKWRSEFSDSTPFTPLAPVQTLLKICFLTEGNEGNEGLILEVGSGFMIRLCLLRYLLFNPALKIFLTGGNGGNRVLI